MKVIVNSTIVGVVLFMLIMSALYPPKEKLDLLAQDAPMVIKGAFDSGNAKDLARYLGVELNSTQKFEIKFEEHKYVLVVDSKNVGSTNREYLESYFYERPVKQ